MYSIALLLLSIFIAIFVKDDKTSKEPIHEKPVFDIKNNLVLKNKLVYIMGLIIFSGYFVTWAQFFVGAHLEINFNASATEVATLMAIFLWTRPIGGMIGGFLADKIGKANVIGGSILLASIVLILLAVIPVHTDFSAISIVVIILGFFIFSIRGTYWSILGDLNINQNQTGFAIGYISLIGYLPDVLAPILLNLVFARTLNETYNLYFIIIAAIGFLGTLMCAMFNKVKKG